MNVRFRATRRGRVHAQKSGRARSDFTELAPERRSSHLEREAQQIAARN